MLAIEQKRLGPNVVVLQLSGRVCMGSAAQQLESTVNELLSAPQKRVVIDLREVTHIDSTGIGIVVLCAGRLKHCGAELRLGGAAGIVEDILRMTKVDSLIAMYDSAEDAASDVRAATA